MAISRLFLARLIFPFVRTFIRIYWCLRLNKIKILEILLLRLEFTVFWASGAHRDSRRDARRDGWNHGTLSNFKPPKFLKKKQLDCSIKYYHHFFFYYAFILTFLNFCVPLFNFSPHFIILDKIIHLIQRNLWNP